MAKLWTPPPTFVANKRLRVGQVNTYGRDNLSVLRNPAVCLAEFFGAGTADELKVPAAQWFAIPLNQERRDSAALHNNESNVTRITVPPASAGLWFWSGVASLTSDTTATWPDGLSRHLGIRRNGRNGAGEKAHNGGGDLVGIASRFPSSFGFEGMTVSALARMAPNDFMELVVYTDASVDYHVTNFSGFSPELRGVFLTEFREGYTPVWHGLATESSGGVLTAGYCNDQLRDNAGWLRYRPAALMTHTLAQSIPNNAWTSLSLNTTLGQNGTWDGTANTLTVPSGMGGLYLISLSASIDAVTGGDDRRAGVILNNTNRVLVENFSGFSSSQAAFNCGTTRLVRLAGGDTLKAQAFQNSGSAQNTRLDTDAPMVTLGACWMAP